MSETPLVSIIVPVYNAAAFLPNTLGAFMGQTYQNAEFVLIDDGSKDASGQICDEFAARDSRFKVIHKKNCGVAAARNTGLEHAKGDLIGFVDSDDVIKDSYIRELVDNMIATDSDISIARSVIRAPEHWMEFEPGSENPEILLFDATQAVQNALISRYYVPGCWGCLIRREVAEGIRFDEELFLDEDLFYILRAMVRARQVCYTKNALYNYISHTSGISRGKFNERHVTLYAATDRITEFLEQNSDYPKVKPYLDSHIVTMNYIQIRRMRYDPEAQKKYGPVSQKQIRKHLNIHNLKYLNNYAKVCAILSAIHYKLYLTASRMLSTKK